MSEYLALNANKGKKQGLEACKEERETLSDDSNNHYTATEKHNLCKS